MKIGAISYFLITIVLSGFIGISHGQAAPGNSARQPDFNEIWHTIQNRMDAGLASRGVHLDHNTEDEVTNWCLRAANQVFLDGGTDEQINKALKSTDRLVEAVVQTYVDPAKAANREVAITQNLSLWDKVKKLICPAYPFC